MDKPIKCGVKIFILITVVFSVYLGFGTKFSFYLFQDIDYYNSLAVAIKSGRLNLENLASTQDLSFYQGKWYPFFGPLPALPILLLQLLLKTDFIPTLPIVSLVGAFGVILVYLLILKTEKEFFGQHSRLPLLFSLLFAFGSSQFWVSVRSGVWFQAQVYAFLLTALGMYFIVRKNRETHDYFWSVLFFSLNLLVRPNAVLLVSIPLLLMFWKGFSNFRKIILVMTPLFVIGMVFFAYNFVRFGSPLETGYKYQKFHPHYSIRVSQAGGWFSPRNIPYNTWFMLFELPKIENLKLKFNPEGNSILFLTPPLLWTFLAHSKSRRDNKKKKLILSIWAGIVITLIPILMLSGTGWYQFGYRYILDIMAPALILVVFGLNGKISKLFLSVVIISIYFHLMGVLTV
ncbi:MAG: hypothetical protein UV05_C0039G0003 [candidate division CPR1 bacterium GW2011_GWA2_42_17]|uniref:Glycosyltransferase RgtA/B/C/D-like domain-containing protein n=1 Tax=candidate division CPR1 bacterium GW2011_GWA2_42_17 TaxID=1618341 RepID=A0A0G1BYZ8_9BACT|nr:MAG: hypothetical protein UV05_C0039G0003 [candidate division CPR1 bacterium GW2011_GWA2_42_17]